MSFPNESEARRAAAPSVRLSRRLFVRRATQVACVIALKITARVSVDCTSAVRPRRHAMM